MSCAELTDKAACCATIDKDGDVCVPAVTAFSDGTVCAGWEHSIGGVSLKNAPADAAQIAACPPGDRAAPSARPREKLAPGVGCSALTDRVACCSASDGRTMAAYEDAPCGSPMGARTPGSHIPCATPRATHPAPHLLGRALRCDTNAPLGRVAVPATTAFQNGAVCESAPHVHAVEVERWGSALHPGCDGSQTNAWEPEVEAQDWGAPTKRARPGRATAAGARWRTAPRWQRRACVLWTFGSDFSVASRAVGANNIPVTDGCINTVPSPEPCCNGTIVGGGDS